MDRRFARLLVAAWALIAAAATVAGSPVSVASPLPQHSATSGDSRTGGNGAGTAVWEWVRISGVEDGGSYVGSVDVTAWLTDAGHRRLQMASHVRVVLDGKTDVPLHHTAVTVDAPGIHSVTVYVLTKPPPPPSRQGIQPRRATLVLPGAESARTEGAPRPRHTLVTRTIRFTVLRRDAAPPPATAPLYGAQLSWGIPQDATRKETLPLFRDSELRGLPIAASTALTNDQHLAVAVQPPSMFVPGTVVQVPVSLRRDDGHGVVVPADVEFRLRVTAVDAASAGQHRDVVYVLTPPCEPGTLC